jgi:hypothetical protein
MQLSGIRGNKTCRIKQLIPNYVSIINNFIKILSLTVKVLWTMRLRCVLAILLILDHSTVFRVITPQVVLIQLFCWGWAQSFSKRVEDSNKHIIEEIVRQVGHLPERTLHVLLQHHPFHALFQHGPCLQVSRLKFGV